MTYKILLKFVRLFLSRLIWPISLVKLDQKTVNKGNNFILFDSLPRYSLRVSLGISDY